MCLMGVCPFSVIQYMQLDALQISGEGSLNVLRATSAMQVPILPASVRTPTGFSDLARILATGYKSFVSVWVHVQLNR